jgi:hypothetical protein
MNRKRQALSVAVRPVVAASALLAALASGGVRADVSEPDNSASLSANTLLLHGAPPALRDLAGVNDIDYFTVDAVPGHSYEVRTMNSRWYGAVVTLTRRNSSDTLLQSGASYAMSSARAADGTVIGNVFGVLANLRWIEDAANRTVYIRYEHDASVTNFSAAVTQYEIEFVETTLYCPRYNNTGTQVSVLIIQRTNAPDSFDSNVCSAVASFFDESAAATGQTGNLSFSSNGMSVVQVANVPGVAGTRGSARIAHTCGYGGIQAKLVALEPATGFSFDTQCHSRQR